VLITVEGRSVRNGVASDVTRLPMRWAMPWTSCPA